MTLEASVLADTSLHQVDQGYQVDIYLPWYRSLTLSAVEKVIITIDGKTLMDHQLQFLVDGSPISFEQIQARYDDEWFVQDPIRVIVSSENTKSKGATAQLDIMIMVRVPYIIIGPNMALPQVAKVSKEVTVQ